MYTLKIVINFLAKNTLSCNDDVYISRILKFNNEHFNDKNGIDKKKKGKKEMLILFSCNIKWKWRVLMLILSKNFELSKKAFYILLLC